MTWKLRARGPNGTIHEILCDTPQQVAENYNDQRARGRKVSIEDANGKVVELASFGLEEDEAQMRTTTDILRFMVDGNGHIQVLRGPTAEYITICREDGTAMFAGDFPRSMLDDLIKQSFVKQDGPENQNKVTVYNLTADGRALGK
jgi:hypothetical protein